MSEAMREKFDSPATRKSTILLACLASVLFLTSWTSLHHGFYARDQIVDTPEYQRYGDWMLHGRVPYKDFSVEYPPAALPAFAVPSIGNAGSENLAPYKRNFEVLMAICGLGAIAMLALTLGSLSASNGWTALALVFVALSPLLLGSVYLSRFDLWPAALTAAALAAFVRGRDRLGFGVLAAAVSAKIYPIVLLPLACSRVWKKVGKRELAACLEIFAIVIVLLFLPFVLISPGSVWDSVERQIARPLQIESLGASLLVACHKLFGIGIAMKSGSGSQNISGGGSSEIAVLMTVLQIGALAGIWVWFARGDVSRERLIRASAAALAAFVGLGKVLSPQYLIWLVPAVPLVRGRRGLLASGLLALALVLTQFWFPYRYWEYALEFAGGPSALVLLRNLILVGLIAALLVPAREPRVEQEAAIPTRAAPTGPGA